MGESVESMVGCDWDCGLLVTVGCVNGGEGNGMTFRWCRKIQNTSFVTLTISRHQTLYGRDWCISRRNCKGFRSSGGDGS